MVLIFAILTLFHQTIGICCNSTSGNVYGGIFMSEQLRYSFIEEDRKISFVYDPCLIFMMNLPHLLRLLSSPSTLRIYALETLVLDGNRDQN